MKSLRLPFLASIVAASLAVLAAWTRPESAQNEAPARPIAAEDNYSGSDADGGYQKALEAAISSANEAVSHAGGKEISDAMFTWQLVSVSGVRGGFAGKRDVTVTIHVKR